MGTQPLSDKEIDQKTAEINARLKAGKVGVRVERRGSCLSLVATLPPRPSSKSKRTLPGFAYRETAILTRANWWADAIAVHLHQMGIPCVTIEQYQFFTRQEIKDALACLRFIINPFDTNALKRMLLRPNRGIGEATLIA